MSKYILTKMKKYIEETEVTIDEEWGKCRSLEQIIADGDMTRLF